MLALSSLPPSHSLFLRPFFHFFFVDLAHTGSPPPECDLILLLPIVPYGMPGIFELVGEDHNDNDNDDDDEDISDHPFCVLFSDSLAAIYSSIIL